MNKKIKLSKKQFDSITATQTQKAELSKAFNEISQREASIIDIILDFNGITEKPSAITLEGDELILSFPDDEKSSKVSKSKRPITDPD